MDKITSLRNTFVRYLIPCCVICAAGILVIEALSVYLQNWYAAKYTETFGVLVEAYTIKNSPEDSLIYRLFFYARVLLIPLWSVCCLLFTAKAFYRREIKAPVDVLTQASERILNDDLDFTVEFGSPNELGKLCCSFENMRKNLYDSNYRLWKSLEERKRLNAAFAHDLRTPVTVLKGYAELTAQFDGKLSPEKQTEILEKMSGQVSRLEHYIEKMNGIHKLEDIIPEPGSFTFGSLCTQLEENGRLICGNTKFAFSANGNPEELLCTDMELVMQVFMNLVSNAQRYAANRVESVVALTGDAFSVTVSDDGSGFSAEALRKAWQPFYRADNENDKEHFGLGLYICLLLCRKAGGSMTVENNETGGGKVTAHFSKNISENR